VEGTLGQLPSVEGDDRIGKNISEIFWMCSLFDVFMKA
jgi:hypothetical protein